MFGYGFIGSIILGAIAGAIAGKLTRGQGFGCWINIFVGIVGGVLGSFLFSLVGIQGTFGLIGNLAVAILGSCVFLWLLSLFTPRS